MSIYPIICVVLINLLWPSQAQEEGITINTGSKYYYIETAETANFFKAAHACAKLGMKLATIETETDLRRIKSILVMNDISANIYWLAGTTNGLTNPTKFIDFLTGKKFKSFSTLTAAANKCVSTEASTFDYKTDVACTDAHNFICEKPLLPYCGKNGQCRYRYL